MAYSIEEHTVLLRAVLLEAVLLKLLSSIDIYQICLSLQLLMQDDKEVSRLNYVMSSRP